MIDNEKLIEEAAKAIRDVREAVVPRGDGYVSVTDADDATLARAALAVFEKALPPADDEREAEFWGAQERGELPRTPGASVREAFEVGFAAGFHRSMSSDSSVETWVCGRCGGGAYEHSLTASTCIWEPIETHPAPQSEPSSAQEAIRVASPDTWDWDACVVCGSKDVTDRGMMVLFSAKDGVYVSRVAWCDQSQECRDDLRQAGASMLTDQDAKSIDAALRAAGVGGVR